ncbi:MAG: hypothetical protein CL693_16645 [Cellvibrionaceae bacterium]|nr:hypothetical protein [Cellvibrionaceae bacterium]|tara:strand:+ start:40668 stop:41045 length:378 start_codon:yes stop_codon:yes gene_type:complete
MTASSPSIQYCPDVFSRGALELTFKLLRAHNNARLALDVQNQLQKSPTKRPPNANRHQDLFRVTLEAHTVGKIIDALTIMGHTLLNNPERESGTIVAIRSLIKDWIALVEWILAHSDDGCSHALH